MPPRPATLTIANFNRQTLSDLLRPVLNRALTQGMVGTEIVVEIVAEALSTITDRELRTFLDPQTGKLRGGLEIRIERVEGNISTITVSGSPAAFQQQPQIEQAIVYASGTSIILDNDNQMITIQGNAAFSQKGTIDTTAERIEYDIANRKLDATQMNMVIPATANP